MGVESVKSKGSLLSAVSPVESHKKSDTGNDLIDQWRSDSFYVEVGINPQYASRVFGVIERIRLRGVPIDPSNIHYGGYYWLLGAAAGTRTLSNEITIGIASGYEDLLLELTLVHEGRHQVQNDQVWSYVARRRRVNPSDYPREMVLKGGSFPSTVEDVIRDYFAWHSDPVHRVGQEIDADLVEYDYFEKYLKDRADPALSCLILGYLIAGIAQHGIRLKKALGDRVLGEQDTFFENPTNDQTLTLLQSEWRRLAGDSALAYVADVQGREWLKAFVERSRRKFVHADGVPYRLRERWVTLNGVADEISLGRSLTTIIPSESPSKPYLEDLAKVATKYRSEIDSLLNRQSLGYGYFLHGPFAHRIDYRNDAGHTRDGFVRVQSHLEWDFKETHEVRGGFDLALNFPLSGFATLKLAPLLYAGYQTFQDNVLAGGRADFRLHLEGELTQRFGLSFFGGMSAGGYFGTRSSDVYVEAMIGAEFFRF